MRASALVAWIASVAAVGSSANALAQAGVTEAGAVKRCATAYEEAQRRQARGELIAAGEQASTCAAMACPAEIVTYCAKLAEELDASTPSVVVALSDGRGRDLDARLFVDQREVRGHLDGRPLRLDPGPHRLRLLPSTGAKPVELQVTLRSGEQNRRIEATIEVEQPQPVRKGSPGIGYAPSIVAFSIGAVGIAVGTATGVMALSQDSELSDQCNGATATCGPGHEDEIDRAQNLGHASTIGFVVGGAGVAAGLILAIVARGSDDGPLRPTATGYRLRF